MKAVELPQGWGAAALFEPHEAPWADAGVTRSYDHGGTALAWRPPAGASDRAACDMERLDKDIGPLAMRFGVPPAAFLPAWTEAEVEAKLHDEPIVLRLRRAALDVDRDGCGCTRLRLHQHGRAMAFGLRGHGPR